MLECYRQLNTEYRDSGVDPESLDHYTHDFVNELLQDISDEEDDLNEYEAENKQILRAARLRVQGN
jgi:hypothetical protein